MTYQGSCHCGRIAYEVDGVPGEAIASNCTHCGAFLSTTAAGKPC